MGYEISWDETLLRIEIVEGFSVSPRATIETEEYGGTVRVEVVYDGFLERLAVESIQVSALPGEEVTGKILRSIRMQDFIREAVEHMIYSRMDDGEWVQFTGLEDYLMELGEAKVDRERVAALVYALAKLMNEPPLKKVADFLGVSQSTATRVVARARAAGMMK
jgi:hypothetical protein